MISIIGKSDTLGATASTLCLVHCLVTPVLFIAQTCTNVCCSPAAGVPNWWLWLDYAFLGVSFFAIIWSAKTTSKNWMKYALWLAWLSLFAVILNERLEGVAINRYLSYAPALILVFLHVYNRKYCACEEDECCIANN